MPRSRQPLIVGAAVFGVLGALLVARTVTAPGFELPPRWYDAQDYENLGYHIAGGRGFGVGWNEPEWTAPYRDERVRGGYKWIDFHRGWRPRDGGFAPTTTRPPALPHLIALTYQVVGREFGAIRVLNALFLALAVGVASGLATQLAGAGAGVATALVASIAPHYAGFARLSMTEPIAAAVLMLALAASWAAVRTGRTRWAGLAGATLGLGILTRSALVLSVPVVAATLYASLRWWRPRKTTPRPATAVLAFLVCALLVPAPWWVRNCATLEAFMPLGAQGGIGLAGAYSDEAYLRTLERKPWTHPNRWNFFEPLLRDPAYQALPQQLQERELARFGQASALEWIAENPAKLPALAWHRLGLHWSMRDARDAGIRLLAVFGALSFVRSRETWIAASFVAANSLAVMATFAVGGGRFLSSVEAILFLFAGAGLGQAWRLASHGWQERRGRPRAQSP